MLVSHYHGYHITSQLNTQHTNYYVLRPTTSPPISGHCLKQPPHSWKKMNINPPSGCDWKYSRSEMKAVASPPPPDHLPWPPTPTGRSGQVGLHFQLPASHTHCTPLLWASTTSTCIPHPPHHKHPAQVSKPTHHRAALKGEGMQTNMIQGCLLWHALPAGPFLATLLG